VPDIIAKHGFKYNHSGCVMDYDWRTSDHWVEGILVDDGGATAERRKTIMKEDLKQVGVAGGIMHFKRGHKVDTKTIFVLCWVAGQGTGPKSTVTIAPQVMKVQSKSVHEE